MKKVVVFAFSCLALWSHCAVANTACIDGRTREKRHKFRVYNGSGAVIAAKCKSTEGYRNLTAGRSRYCCDHIYVSGPDFGHITVYPHTKNCDIETKRTKIHVKGTLKFFGVGGIRYDISCENR